jgi:hypothetical protein
MSNEVDGSTVSSPPWRVEEAHAAEVELERARWKAITAFVDLLTADERPAPGYERTLCDPLLPRVQTSQ